MKLIIKVTKGEFNSDNLLNRLDELKDGNYEVNVKKARAIRSLNQNNYYWGFVVGDLFEVFGETVTPQEIHEFLGYKFLKTSHRNALSDELVDVITSTTKLNTKQMEEYIEQCRKYSLEEYNHRIKLPNETEFNY